MKELRKFVVKRPIMLNHKTVLVFAEGSVENQGKVWYYLGKSMRDLGLSPTVWDSCVGTLKMTEAECKHYLLRSVPNGITLVDGSHIDLIIGEIPSSVNRRRLADEWSRQRVTAKNTPQQIDLLPDGMEPSEPIDEIPYLEPPPEEHPPEQIEEAQVVEAEEVTTSQAIAEIDDDFSKGKVHRFEAHEITSIRDANGQPWFIAKQVAEILGYAKPSQAVYKHCKHSREINTSALDGVGIKEASRSMLIINQGDVNRLIGSARTEQSSAIRDWWYDEVLPAYMSGTSRSTEIAPAYSPRVMELIGELQAELVKGATPPEEVSRLKAELRLKTQQLDAMLGVAADVERMGKTAIKLAQALKQPTQITQEAAE